MPATAIKHELTTLFASTTAVLIILFAVSIFFAVLKLRLKSRKRYVRTSRTTHYIAKPLMTEVEKKLYFRLTEALPQYRIFTQVQLIQIVGINNTADRLQWLNKIRQLSADFVVCDHNCNVIVVIELDDKTHEVPRQQYRDCKKNAALEEANIRLIRWHVRHLPTVEQIRQAIPAQAAAA